MTGNLKTAYYNSAFRKAVKPSNITYTTLKINSGH